MSDPKVIGPKAYVLSAIVGRSLNNSTAILAASPMDMVEGMLMATEILIGSQITLGLINMDEISAIRSRIAEWVLKSSQELEDSGEAATIRAHFANVLQNKLKDNSN